MEGVLSEGVLTFVQRGFCPRTLSYNLWPSYPVFIPLTTVVGFHSGCVILSLRPCLILPRNTLFNANVSFNAILQQKWSVSGLLDTDKGFDFPLSSAPSPLSPVPLPLARLTPPPPPQRRGDARCARACYCDNVISATRGDSCDRPEPLRRAAV